MVLETLANGIGRGRAGGARARVPAAVLLAAALLAAPGCASRRPVLYPNPQLEDVGAAAAQEDVDACLEQARADGVDRHRGREVATNTGGGAAVGAATGAAVGAIRGSAGRGAALGAVAGGVGGLFRGLFRSREPDPVFRNYVDTCLRERGYQPIGWR